MDPLLLDEPARAALWRQVVDAAEAYIRDVETLPVAPELDPRVLRALLAEWDFATPSAPERAVAFAVEGLTRHQVHTPHPRYFGLFNPAPTAAGIAADTLVAAFNPQMAAWSHNPFAAEVERHLVLALAERFGYAREQADGTFCSGGAEANHTAVLAALAHRFPAYARDGLRALEAQPVLYVSSDAHHSLLKAARLCGLGTRAVRVLPTGADLRLDPADVARRVREDRAAGLAPFLVAGTAGTTAAGVVDPLPGLASLAEEEGLWLHVDAAWGGGAALVPELRPVLEGIERADSITFDAHKWLSVPMGAGIFLTRHPDILTRTFATANTYMPSEAEALGAVDPYAHSMQWSRRFTGLKVFLSLAVAGWDGYAAVIRRQAALGDLLRERLADAGWEIVNRTPLPVVCFRDPVGPDEDEEASLEAICRGVTESGAAWISVARVGPAGQPVLRACITNYRTAPEDVDALVTALGAARAALPLRRPAAPGARG